MTIQEKKFKKLLDRKRTIFSEYQKKVVLQENVDSKDNYVVSLFLTDLVVNYCINYFHNNYNAEDFIKNRPSTKLLMNMSDSCLALFFYQENSFLPYYNKYYYHYFLKYKWEEIVRDYLTKIGYENS